MDLLDDIIQTLAMQGALYFRTDFSPPWSVTVPDLDSAARFHLVVQGQCKVTLPDRPVITLNPGEVILIPRGQTHILSDAPVATAPPLETVLADTGYDGKGLLAVGDGNSADSTQMICGHFTFRRHADHPLLRALPDHFVASSALRAQNPWLDDILRMISRSMFSEKIGADASAKRLSEVMFIELLRMGLEELDHMQPLLRGFNDPNVGQALELLHGAPEAPWTVSSLAREVGMSRSGFAERFAELLGQGPMSYLTDWRLQKALGMLDKSDLSVKQIAAQTGYQSAAAFTRAFAGKFGVAPTKYR